MVRCPSHFIFIGEHVRLFCVVSFFIFGLFLGFAQYWWVRCDNKHWIKKAVIAFLTVLSPTSPVFFFLLDVVAFSSGLQWASSRICILQHSANEFGVVPVFFVHKIFWFIKNPTFRTNIPPTTCWIEERPERCSAVIECDTSVKYHIIHQMKAVVKHKNSANRITFKNERKKFETFIAYWLAVFVPNSDSKPTPTRTQSQIRVTRIRRDSLATWKCSNF